MSSISNLFENLMTYNDVNAKSIKKHTKRVIENDNTLLNLSVELPEPLDDVKPDDIKVNVGLMTVDTDEAETKNNDDENESDDHGKVEVKDGDEDEVKDNDEDEKNESVKLNKQKTCKCHSKDCAYEECKSKKESKDYDTAIKNIRKRVANNTVTESKDKNSVKVKNLKVGNKLLIALSNDKKPKVRTIRELPSKGAIIFSDGSHVELKPNEFVTLAECSTKKESLMHLDTTSLNKLFTQFVRDNYKNIDKVVISKAVLENNKLTLKGKIINTKGIVEKVSFTNNGFNGVKLENKRFLIDFSDNLNTFNIVKEHAKRPFQFIATLKEGILSFESLDYSFKTVCESKKVQVYGNIEYVKESIRPKYENSDQVKVFNEISEKIKNAKNANDLLQCKELMNKSNIGDTLKSALQLIWDDVNSRMVNATKNK